MLNGKIRHKKVSPEHRSPLNKGYIEEWVLYELSTCRGDLFVRAERGTRLIAVRFGFAT